MKNSTALLTVDDLLVIIYRLVKTLLYATTPEMRNGYSQQLARELREPKPGDLVMRTGIDNDPIALKVGWLIYYTPKMDECLSVHTVQLLDGTVTTWRGCRVVKVPTAVFAMRTDA